MTQRYISKELFHFIGREKGNDEDRYEIMKKILLSTKLISPNSRINDDFLSFKYDESKKLSSNEMYTPAMVCFCDIPFGDLKLHMNKYKSFGISFLKEYLLPKGINPIWYISKYSNTDSKTFASTNEDFHNRLHEKFKKVFNELISIKNNTSKEDQAQWCKDIDELFCYFDFRVFSFMKFFDAKKGDIDLENYYMEREWRLLGKLDFENIDNITRIIIPKEFIDKFKNDFPNFKGQINFSEPL